MPSVQSKQTSQPPRKSYRLAAQGFSARSSVTKQGPLVTEEIESLPEGSPTKRSETATSKQALSVPGSKQASTETSPPSSKQTPTSRPVPKRKASSKHGPTAKPAEAPKCKQVKTSALLSPNLDKFLKMSVVWGKIVKVGYFKEQGPEVFLEKLRSQGWLELFTNT